VATNPRVNRIPPLAKPLKYIAAEIVKVNKANEVSNGQGEGVTKWNFQDKGTLMPFPFKGQEKTTAYPLAFSSFFFALFFFALRPRKKVRQRQKKREKTRLPIP